MQKHIDCFFIGQNQINFQDYEKFVRKQGVQSGAYRDLHINTIRHDGKIYSAADAYNEFCCRDTCAEPIKSVESFSAGIAYLGSFLHRRGYSFDFVNSFQDEKDVLEEKLKNEDIMAVGILTTFYITPEPIVEIIRFIKQHDQKVKIIVGGPFIASIIRCYDDNVLQYLFNYIGADFYVYSSQGESTLVNILGALKNNASHHTIDNIYFRSGKRFASNRMVREYNRLSENMVAWDLFKGRTGGFVNVRTAISCPFTCSFCAFPEHAGKHQTAEVAEVEKELDKLTKIQDVRAVIFVDDTFNIPEKRFKDLLKMMIKNKYPFKWASFLRCQYVDRETVEMMKESGCQLVLLGIESGNEKILKIMNKSASVDKYYHGLSLLKEYGIISMGNFFIGFPGETEGTVADTVEFIKTSGLDFYRTQLWYYDHITPIAAKKDKYSMKGAGFDWSHSTMDSQGAADLIEDIILSIEGHPVRYPEYYFDWDNVFQLYHKGRTMDQIKSFLRRFDDAVKEKLRDPSKAAVSLEAIGRLRESCNGDQPLESQLNPDDQPKIVEHFL